MYAFCFLLNFENKERVHELSDEEQHMLVLHVQKVTAMKGRTRIVK